MRGSPALIGHCGGRPGFTGRGMTSALWMASRLLLAMGLLPVILICRQVGRQR